MDRIILASASPRRKELLSSVVEGFEILTADTDETVDPSVHPRDAVRMLAERKGYAVLCTDPSLNDAIIISSDTLVEMDGKPLGKPADTHDARRMLSELSGRGHNVHTGIAVRYKDTLVSGVATTEVAFRAISGQEIDDYIDSGEPMDKAGSYGIQGLGGKFVKEIRGDFDTVVGFSLKLLRSLLCEIGKEDVLC